MSSLSSQPQELGSRPQLDTCTLNSFLQHYGLGSVYGDAIRTGGCNTDAEFRNLCNYSMEGITGFVDLLQLSPFQITTLKEKIREFKGHVNVDDIKPLQQESKRLSDELNEIKSKKMKFNVSEAKDILTKYKVAPTNAIRKEGFSLGALTFEERVTLLSELGKEPLENNQFKSLSDVIRIISDKEINEVSRSSSSSHDIPLESDDCTPNQWISFQNHRFPVIGEATLFVRKSYRDLYKIISGHYGSKYDIRILLSGTSGMGKSTFLLYFLIRFLNEFNNRIVVFHPQTKNQFPYYAFTKNFVRGITAMEIFDFLDLKETVYLADGRHDANIVQAFSITALSPRSLTTTAEKTFQIYEKSCTHIFYMPPWSLEELETLRAKIFAYIKPEFLLEFFAHVGGVPRYALQMPGYVLRDDENNLMDALQQQCLRRVTQALTELNTPEKAVTYIRSVNNTVQYSNLLVHVKPKDDRYTDIYPQWASPYVEQEILQLIDDNYLMEVLDGIQKGEEGAAKGFKFESVMICAFQIGGIKFECKELLEGGRIGNTYTILMPKKPKVKRIRVPNNISDQSINIEDNDLLLPTKCNFPAIDALLAPHVLFQFTVSKAHPILQHPLVDIVSNLHPPNHIIPLVFVVPSEIYNNFKYQNYKVPKTNLAHDLDSLKDAERTPQELDNVQQMAMKVDLTQMMQDLAIIKSESSIANDGTMTFDKLFSPEITVDDGGEQAVHMMDVTPQSAPSSTPVISRPLLPEDDFSQLTNKQLKELCKLAGISYRGKDTKQVLIKKLNNQKAS
ncbi:11815_t:CDS:2 [Paraglomus brasilianum]|uniref:11815_t:CDS:1 n=1 Tax=Paraglomus brasilianum TaxID=144538 RepID=A0A9N9GXJ2_9GLOM|nr:11815_t:CDS:2 [Paraglomus brasilianum]